MLYGDSQQQILYNNKYRGSLIENTASVGK